MNNSSSSVDAQMLSIVANVAKGTSTRFTVACLQIGTATVRHSYSYNQRWLETQLAMMHK